MESKFQSSLWHALDLLQWVISESIQAIYWFLGATVVLGGAYFINIFHRFTTHPLPLLILGIIAFVGMVIAIGIAIQTRVILRRIIGYQAVCKSGKIFTILNSETAINYPTRFPGVDQAPFEQYEERVALAFHYPDRELLITLVTAKSNQAKIFNLLGGKSVVDFYTPKISPILEKFKGAIPFCSLSVRSDQRRDLCLAILDDIEAASLQDPYRVISVELI